MTFRSYISRVTQLVRALRLLPLMVVAGCTHDLQLAPHGASAAATTTTGPWASMIFVARTDSGVIAIDLGWTDAAEAMTHVLGRIEAKPADVRWVFLTHAHRDHIGAWPLVRQATFVLGQAEGPYFTGAAHYTGLVPRIGDRMKSYRQPKAGEVRVIGLGGDSLFVLGHDTLRTFATPGHTAGSTSYLFRETLFVGDAANWRATSGFRGARSEYSDDIGESHRSMAKLLERLDRSGVRWRVLCTAHGKCGLADSTLRRDILR